MPRFFVSAGDVRDGCARIAGADAAHLARSLRARRGERIVVVDDSGVEHGILLDTVDADAVTGTVEWSRPATGEPRCRVLVLQALAAEGMDEAVEALAETGAAEIWPLLTERTVARPDARRAAGRVERWSAIARQAAALAGRAGPMPVRPIRSLADALEDLPTDTRIASGAPKPRMAPLVGLFV